MEICILLKFVKQNENSSIYEADICTDALIGTQDIEFWFVAILVDICGHSWILDSMIVLVSAIFSFLNSIKKFTHRRALENFASKSAIF